MLITTAAWRTRMAWAAAFLLLCAAFAGRAFGNDPMMGMQIDSVQVQAESATVTTTGTEFVLDRAQNQIRCYQRIPEWRQVATINGLSLSGLALQSQNARQCVLNTQQGSLTIGADGLMTMSMSAAANFGVTGSYLPAYHGISGDNLFLPDATGGVGMYSAGGIALQTPTAWSSNWTVNCQANANSKLLMSVFPPRPFDVQQANQTVVQTFSYKEPYPSDQEISAWSKVGTVLALHHFTWQGNAGSTYGVWNDLSNIQTTFTPKNDAELRRVVSTAHSVGMKVLPYMSPFYYGGVSVSSTTMPAYLNQVQRVVSDYGLDGVYIDGLYQDDVVGSYNVMKGLRQIVGDSGILYLHATSLPLDVPCPAIDTYATYVLRGEHMPWVTDDFVRWQISNYNIGNAVGMFCYDTVRPNSALINTLLSDNARLPYWVQEAIFPGYVDCALTPDEVNLLNAEYFPRLVASEPSAVALLSIALFGVMTYVWRKRTCSMMCES
jgi:hypothetical protein